MEGVQEGEEDGKSDGSDIIFPEDFVPIVRLSSFFFNRLGKAHRNSAIDASKSLLQKDLLRAR
jgi:hypothetical protein